MSGQRVPYYKMNGAGNAITVLDLRDGGTKVTGDHARALAADPRTEFDQLMVLYPPRTPETQSFMTIFNSDGSTAGACGNGTRCVADILARDTGRETMLLESATTLLPITFEPDGRITVDMGAPKFRWDEIPLAEEFYDTKAIELQIGPIDDPILDTPAAVNMGNPHAIFWVDNFDGYDLESIGPLLENHPIFPDRANITLANVTANDAITVKVWERGAGQTKACGSAACATLVSAARKRKTGREATVTLPGGELFVRWRENDNHVLMTGPVELEAEGFLSLEPFTISEAA